MWEIMDNDTEEVQETTEENIRQILSGNYMDVDIVIEASKNMPNMWFRTSGFSHFRWVEEK